MDDESSDEEQENLKPIIVPLKEVDEGAAEETGNAKKKKKMSPLDAIKKESKKHLFYKLCLPHLFLEEVQSMKGLRRPRRQGEKREISFIKPTAAKPKQDKTSKASKAQ